MVMSAFNIYAHGLWLTAACWSVIFAQPTVQGQNIPRSSGLAGRGQEAAVIAVGTATRIAIDPDGPSYLLKLVKVIKGQQQPFATVRVPVGSDPRLPPPPEELPCGIWLLAKGGSAGSYIAMQRPGEIGVASAFYPAPSCTNPRGAGAPESVLDSILLEITAGAEADPKPSERYLTALFYDLDPTEASEVTHLASQLSNKTGHSGLQQLGLAWQIVQGDAIALDRLAGQSGELLRAPARMVVTAIEEYSNPNPVGVHALGRIARAEGLNQFARLAAARALRNLHTKETLPYLAAMLDDELFREYAISGFGYFRMGAPPLNRLNRDGKALDDAMRAFRRSDSDSPDAKYIRIGPLPDKPQQTVLVEFWKTWFLQNRARLGI